MTTLRIIIDEMMATTPGAVGRYTEELTRALIAVAPRGCHVEAFVSASSDADYSEIAERLPGLAVLHKSALARRELASAWQHGFTRLPGSGMVHAPSLLAPLSRHDRVNNGDQIAVTVHDTVAWSRPAALSARSVARSVAMLKRAERYADAVVVPSHAVLAELSDIANFGGRVRVISGAGGTGVVVPNDADERADRLALPPRYIAAVGAPEPHRGIDSLVAAMAQVEDVPLLLVGPDADDPRLAASAIEAGVPPDRIRGIGPLDDPDFAVVVDRAAVFVYPNLEEGFGMPILEAFALGTPVVHSDAPAFLELAADAGVAVARGDEYPEALAEAITTVLDDAALAERLGYAGHDRAGVFSWRSSAEKVWQLHADL